MHKLYKKNGTEVEVNDNSLAYALSLGWTKANPTKKAVKSGNSTKRSK